MAYCTNADLTLLTGTTLSTTVQDAIILQADNEINGLIYAAGLTPPGADNTLKAASLKLSSAGVMTRARMDGSRPSTLTVGEYTSSDNIDQSITELRTAALVLVDSYIVRINAATRQIGRAHV